MFLTTIFWGAFDLTLKSHEEKSESMFRQNHMRAVLPTSISWLFDIHTCQDRFHRFLLKWTSFVVKIQIFNWPVSSPDNLIGFIRSQEKVGENEK
jgi:hypothetical protein